MNSLILRALQTKAVNIDKLCFTAGFVLLEKFFFKRRRDSLAGCLFKNKFIF